MSHIRMLSDMEKENTNVNKNFLKLFIWLYATLSRCYSQVIMNSFFSFPLVFTKISSMDIYYFVTVIKSFYN